MPKTPISMDDLIKRARSHPNIAQAGMVLCHNGFVRASDRSGARKVLSLQVQANTAKIEETIAWAKSQPGIVEVIVEAIEGELFVGEDLLYVVVAGDLRENVFRVMSEVIDRLKKEGVSKRETYAD